MWKVIFKTLWFACVLPNEKADLFQHKKYMCNCGLHICQNEKMHDVGLHICQKEKTKMMCSNSLCKSNSQNPKTVDHGFILGVQTRKLQYTGEFFNYWLWLSAMDSFKTTKKRYFVKLSSSWWRSWPRSWSWPWSRSWPWAWPWSWPWSWWKTPLDEQVGVGFVSRNCQGALLG